MRNVVIQIWCDACPIDKPMSAAHSFTVGVTEQEDTEAPANRPVMFTLDLCATHATDYIDPVQKLLVNAVPLNVTKGLPAPKPRKVPSAPVVAAVAPAASADGICQVCGAEMLRSSLVSHVWSHHRKDKRPVLSEWCPDCGEQFEGNQGAGVHRRKAHGYDALAEAYKGAK